MRPGQPTASSGSTVDANLVEQFVRMGADRNQVVSALKRQAAQAAARPKPAADDKLVLPRHLWPAVQLAIELRSQRRVAALPGGGLLVLGLDYAARDDVMKTLGLPRRGRKGRTLLGQFRVVEEEMTTVANARHIKVN